MPTRSWKSVPPFTVVIAAMLVSSACHLDRRALGGLGKLEPAQFCPGDTVRASFDLLREETCGAGVDCSPHFPTVVLSSAPESFPRSTFRSYADGLDFTPTADSVAVTFDIDREAVNIPTDRFDGDGNRIWVQRTPIADHTLTARRAAPFDRELVHDGICDGATPINAPAELPGPPQLSPGMRLASLCNVNAIPITATLSGDAGSYSRSLAPGECLDTTIPGVPGEVAAFRTVRVSRLTADSGARCTATGPNSPPAPLRTLAHMECR